MLDNQINAFKRILTDEDLQKYAGEGFWNLIKAVIMSDPLAGLETVKNIKDLIFHIPTLLFWDKMQRYLTGSFSCFEDQVKMAAKFDCDNSDYASFVKKQVHLIDEIDDDEKIDYFAALTRCFLLTELDQSLFFKLSKFLVMCTPHELHFLATIPADYKAKNNTMISALYQYGLFTQDTNSDDTVYVLSDFAIALKQNSLNFDAGLKGENRLITYDRIAPLSIAEPITSGDLENIWNSNETVLDGGKA